VRIKKEDGFSMLELIISLSLSTIVLIGVISMATQVVRNEYGAIKSGEVSALTLNGLDAMNRELEKATYIEPASPSAGGGSLISGCLNYSSVLNGMAGLDSGSGKIDASNPKKMGFIYCVRSSGTPGRFDSLIRHPQVGTYDPSCPMAHPACGAAGTYDVIIGNNISLYDGYGAGNYFQRDDTVGGIRMHYIVGNATGSTTAARGHGGHARPGSLQVRLLDHAVEIVSGHGGLMRTRGAKGHILVHVLITAVIIAIITPASPGCC